MSFPVTVASGHDRGSFVQEFTAGTGSGESFLVGDFVVYDTAGDYVKLAGTNPTLIAGIAEADSAQARLLTANAKGVAPGKVPIRILGGDGIVLAMGSTTTPTDAMIGDSYGITRNAAGRWLLDTTKTGTSSRVRVVGHNGKDTFYVVLHSNLLQFADLTVATA